MQGHVAVCSDSQSMWTADGSPGPGLSPGHCCPPPSCPGVGKGTPRVRAWVRLQLYLVWPSLDWVCLLCLRLLCLQVWLFSGVLFSPPGLLAATFPLPEIGIWGLGAVLGKLAGGEPGGYLEGLFTPVAQHQSHRVAWGPLGWAEKDQTSYRML